MNHYFCDNRHLAQNRKELSFRFWCFTLQFISDNGVFSKKDIDYGTRVLLNTIYQHKERVKDDVLDLGCGYGTIGITLKKALDIKSVTMVDVNPRAIALAKENASLNQVVVNIKESNSFQNLETQCFSDIITNPPIRAGKKVIYEMFTQAYTHLISGGNLWVVIRKSHGAASACTHIQSIFGNCEILAKEKGYWILIAKKH